MGQYTLHEFRQMLSRMIPSERFRHRLSAFYGEELQEEVVRRLFGIIDSMTFLERTRPAIIDRERTDRIARGSGANPGDVTEVLRQFAALKSMMDEMGMGR